MKSPGAITHKLKQVQYRHRAKELDKALAKEPCNCSFNKVLNLPDGSQIGVCLYKADSPQEWGGIVCDSDFGGSQLARECPFFSPAKTKEQVKQEFEDFVKSADIAEIAFRYPDMAALMWVLGVERVVDGEDSLSSPKQLESRSQVENFQVGVFPDIHPSLWQKLVSLFFGKK